MATDVIAKVKVCIVGAGISGLTAAATLVEAGVEDIIVLEAQDRIGGRVHTTQHEGKHLEIGAQWIHGEDGNSIYEWASKQCPDSIDTSFDLTQTGTGKTVFVDPHGNVISEEVTEAFQNLMTKLDAEDPPADCTASYGEYCEQRFAPLNKWGSQGWQLLDWHGRFLSNVDGAPSWHVTTAANRKEYEECPGNSVVSWTKGGYQLVLDDLLKRVGSGRVRLNSPVLNIKWASNSMEDPSEQLANLSISDSASPCLVCLPKGEVQATHVIFTPSLGYLKENALNIFTPHLPSHKINAIQGLGFDSVAKVYISFKERWWPEDIDGFSFLNDLSSSPPDHNEEWPSHVLGFYKVALHPLMLCSWINGPPSRAMESTPLDQVIYRCYEELCRRLRGKYQVTEPVWGCRSQWTLNPFIRGAYSFRSLESDKRDAWPSHLAEPLCRSGVPVVCFAGEATHDRFFSTVHGAHDSGLREAKRLLPFLKPTVAERLCSVATLRTEAPLAHPKVLLVGSSAALLSAAVALRRTLHSTSIVIWPPMEQIFRQQLKRKAGGPCIRAQSLLNQLLLMAGSPKGLSPRTINKLVSELPFSEQEAFWGACEGAMESVWGQCRDRTQQLMLYLRALANITCHFGSGSIYRNSEPSLVSSHRPLTVRLTCGMRQSLLMSDFLVLDSSLTPPRLKSRQESIISIDCRLLSEATEKIKGLQRKLSPSLPPSPPAPAFQHYSIAIIGAGAAALGALTALNARGINSIRVVEGSDRIGGRVATLYPDLCPSSPVELGAQWVHGQEGNAFYHQIMKVEPGLISNITEEDGAGHFLLSGGCTVSEALWREVWRYFRAREELMCGEDVAQESVSEVLLDPTAWQAFLSAKVEGDRSTCEALREWVVRWYLIDNACSDLKQLSARHWDRYEFPGGLDNIRPSQGMLRMMDALYRRRNYSISFNSTVCRVRCCREVVSRKGRLLDGRATAQVPPVLLFCSDGEIIGADAAIVTSSIGHLQRHRDMFVPPLPHPLRKAVSCMGFGTMNKIVLEYTSAWWAKDCGRESLQIVHRKEDWRAWPASREWLRHVSGFDNSFGEVPRLTCWVAGEGAIMTERLSEQQIGLHCTELLRHFLPTAEVPLPVQVYRSQWASNPLHCGTYSFPSTAFEGNRCHVEELSAPVEAQLVGKLQSKVPILVLAGEANSAAHFSTVHGAYSSGLQQGQLLATAKIRLDCSVASSL